MVVWKWINTSFVAIGNDIYDQKISQEDVII